MYTLTVIIQQTAVINHLYCRDQFCGFDWSSGPSHTTRFASGGVSVGDRASTAGLGDSRGASPPYISVVRSAVKMSRSSFGDKGMWSRMVVDD